MVPTLTAYDHNGDVDVTVVSNNVDTSTIGTYEVIYSASNDIGETLYKITVHVDAEPSLSDYYSSAEGLSGNNLLIELRSIITTNSVSYDAARDILQISDRDPNNSSNILLVYNRASVISTWDSGVTWNREHVWPQSLLSGASSSDIHNLKPSNNSINSSRGNKTFVDGSGSYGAVGNGWYPGDDDRGDIARIIFYMVTRYSQLNISTMGSLNTFLLWHEGDPVDDFERNRNEVLYFYQGNRNPYIDYPHFVELIWGNAPTSSSHFVEQFNIIVDNLVEYDNVLNEYKTIQTTYVRLN